MTTQDNTTQDNAGLRLHGAEAIDYAEEHDCTLCKYADPIEDYREGLTVAEAREIAFEDPSLVYIDVPTTEPSPLEWPRSNGIRCTSKCGRAILRRVGCDYRRDWAVSVDGEHHGTYHGLATAKRIAQSCADGAYVRE